MVELFKDDKAFINFLLTSLFDKMKQSKKVEFNDYTKAFVCALTHTEYLHQLTKVLVSYEEFHLNNDFELYYTILKKA